MSSWLSRVACRYEMKGSSLAWRLISPRLVPPPYNDLRLPVQDIDWRMPTLHKQRLAAAARLKRADVARLDAAMRYPLPPKYWFAQKRCVRDPWAEVDYYREEFAWGWCDLCVAEDYARSGQQYIRLEWTLACVGYCHRHKRWLTSRCACGANRRPIHVPHGAHTLLVCRFCGRSTAQPGGDRGYDERRLVRARDLQLAFESDLIGALCRRTPSPRWCGVASADELLALVDDMAYALCTRVFYDNVPPIDQFSVKWTLWRNEKFPYIADVDHKLCALPPYWRAIAIGAILAIIGDEDVCQVMSIDLGNVGPPLFITRLKWHGTLDWLINILAGRQVRRLLGRSANWPVQMRDRLYAATAEQRRTGRYANSYSARRLDHGFVWM